MVTLEAQTDDTQASRRSGGDAQPTSALDDDELLVFSLTYRSCTSALSDFPAWPIDQKPAIASHQKPSQPRAKEVA